MKLPSHFTRTIAAAKTQPKFRGARSENGVALIIVLVVITVLGILAGGFAYSMKIEMRLAQQTTLDSDFEWMGRFWQGLRWLAPLLALMAVARALTELAGPFLDLGAIRLSIPGLVQGTLFAWRLMLMVLLGSILTATTSPSGVKAAVTWFLKPFPLVPAARVGTMLSLLLRFIPLIFQQAGQTLEAQRARAVDRRKNPIYRLRCFGLPFLRRTLLTADRMTEAMEARCYSDRRTGPQLTFTAGDGLFACGVCGLAGLILWL